MTDLSSFLDQAEQVRSLLERGRYAEARLVNFRLVCALRGEVLNNEEAPASPGA